jgi:hypothetical protein
MATGFGVVQAVTHCWTMRGAWCVVLTEVTVEGAAVAGTAVRAAAAMRRVVREMRRFPFQGTISGDDDDLAGG